MLAITVVYYITPFPPPTTPYHLQQMCQMHMVRYSIFTPVPHAFNSSICSELISGAVKGLFLWRHYLSLLLILLSYYEI